MQLSAYQLGLPGLTRHDLMFSSLAEEPQKPNAGSPWQHSLKHMGPECKCLPGCHSEISFFVSSMSSFRFLRSKGTAMLGPDRWAAGSTSGQDFQSDKRTDVTRKYYTYIDIYIYVNVLYTNHTDSVTHISRVIKYTSFSLCFLWCFCSLTEFFENQDG